MRRYDKLCKFLSEQDVAAKPMTFREVEEVLGLPLPYSAYNHQAWWGNDPNPSRHSYAWLSSGWETEELDLVGKKVTFRRTGKALSGQPSQSRKEAMAQSEKRKPAISSESLPFADTPTVQVSVELKWCHLGTLARDGRGKLDFPTAPNVPGLYRFRLKRSDGNGHYIGEATELRRRFQRYRTPSKSKKNTNRRINKLMKKHLESGGSVEVDIILDGVVLKIGDEKVDADLSNKATRRLLENAALVAEGRTGIEILNR